MKRKKQPRGRLVTDERKEAAKQIRSVLMGIGLGIATGFAKQLGMSSAQFIRVAKDMYEEEER